MYITTPEKAEIQVYITTPEIAEIQVYITKCDFLIIFVWHLMLFEQKKKYGIMCMNCYNKFRLIIIITVLARKKIDKSSAKINLPSQKSAQEQSWCYNAGIKTFFFFLVSKPLKKSLIAYHVYATVTNKTDIVKFQRFAHHRRIW